MIRKLKVSDARISYKWRNDKEVFKYTGNTYSNYISYETELEWIKKVIKKKEDYRCAIMVDDEYVGNIYLTDIDNQKAEYHIFIGKKQYWGKGIAYQASILILKYAFDVLNLSKVELKVNKMNGRAVNLYRILGFEPIMEKDNIIYMVKRKV